MTSGTERAVSDALVAIALHADAEELHGVAAKPTGSRAHILTTLESSGRDFSIEELAQDTGLHPNTVRSHLDVLVAGGRVERIQGQPHGRGRPRLAFRAAADARAPYEELSRLLHDSLGAANAPGLARRTAERWARSVEPKPLAASADEAVDDAVESLRAIGFSAEASQLRDSIVVGSCPFAQLVEEYPVICAIHTELLSTMLSASGQEVAVEGMDVWVKPTLCRARLTRPNLAPARTIDITSPSARPSAVPTAHTSPTRLADPLSE